MEIQEYSTQASQWFQSAGMQGGPAEKNLLLIAVLASFVAVLISLGNRRRIRSAGAFEIHHLVQRVEKLTLDLNSSTNRLQNEHEKLKAEIRHLTEGMNSLSRGEIPPRAPSSPEEGLKKKLKT